MLPKRQLVALKDSLAVNSIFNYSMYYRNYDEWSFEFIQFKKMLENVDHSCIMYKVLCTVHTERLS